MLKKIELTKVKLLLLLVKLVEVKSILMHANTSNNLLRMLVMSVATPLLEECEDDFHTPEMGTWESSETPEISEFNCRAQNTSP